LLNASLEERFCQELLARGLPAVNHNDQQGTTLSFSVAFTALLASALPDEVTSEGREALAKTIRTQQGMSPERIEVLLDVVLAPENRSSIEEDALRAFGSRFGRAEEEALRSAVAEEINMSIFAKTYGATQALTLLDSLFAVCAVDGVIDRREISTLERAASELGIDPALVGALFRKYDSRHAQGDFKFKVEEGGRYVIGRSPSADIRLPDVLVGQRHVELVHVGDGWRVKDLGCGRPTLINGAPIVTAPFQPGDLLRVGPYSLELAQDGQTVTAFGEQSFSALSVRQLQRRIGSITLLDGVTFTVFSGEVVAIIGPSGSGKTTLLNAISGIAPASSGDVLLDGQDLHSLLASDRSIAGIVPQDDVIHEELTVEESLQYAGRLRFPADVRMEQVNTEVKRVLVELGLTNVRNTLIGSALKRGVSGGQRKRASLGQEMLTKSTKILFLDEPTSGLDPQTGQDILSLVRQLADNGRIVFLVTHDVTPSMMSMIDHLLVLAPGGKQAWFGPTSDAKRWFDVQSIDQVFGVLAQEPPDEWKTRYFEGIPFRKFVRPREDFLRLDERRKVQRNEQKRTLRRSWLLQYVTLTRRYTRVKMRDSMGLAVLLAQAPILGLAMKVVFPEPDAATLFMLALSALWFGASASVRELISDRPIWYRESRIGLRLLPYMASKVTVLGALVTLQCTLLAAMNWTLLDMGSGSGDVAYGFSLLALCGVTSLTGLVGMSMGLLISALFSSSEAAVGALPVVLIPQITFGGLIVKVKEMSLLSKAVAYLMITRYSFDATIKTGEYLSRPGSYGNNREPLHINGVLYDLGFRTSAAQDMGLVLSDLVLILFGFSVVFLVFATWFASRKRLT